MGFFNTGKCEICGATDGVRENEQLSLTMCRTCNSKYKSVIKGNSNDETYFESLKKFPVCSMEAKKIIDEVILNKETPVSEYFTLSKSSC